MVMQSVLRDNMQHYLLLGHSCPLQFLFDLRVLLLQLCFSLLQLVFLLQPLNTPVLRQPTGGTKISSEMCCLSLMKSNCLSAFFFLNNGTWVADLMEGRPANVPLSLVLAPLGLSSSHPQLLPHSVQCLSQTLVCLHQVTLRLRQRPQLDAQLLVLLLGSNK